jgi:hypothetical protein
MDKIADALVNLIQQKHPRSLLAVGRYACELCDRLSGAGGSTAAEIQIDCLPHYTSLDDLEPARLFDLALVAGVLESLPMRAGAALIARLRDVQAKKLILLVSNSLSGEHNRWQRQDLLALGLHHQSSYDNNGQAAAIYTFDIGNYKPTPDWLNPSNWAHPERWDKDRW